MSAPALPKGHDEYEALAVAWAIDALEPADQELFEGHRDGCDVCASAVITALQVATELAYGVPDVDPPASLRQRVLAAAAPRPPVPGTSPEGSSGQGTVRRDGLRAEGYELRLGDLPDRGATADDFADLDVSERDIAQRDAENRGASPQDTEYWGTSQRDAGHQDTNQRDTENRGASQRHTEYWATSQRDAGHQDTNQRDTENRGGSQRDAASRDAGRRDLQGRNAGLRGARNSGGEREADSRDFGRRAGAGGAHRSAARRAAGRPGGGPRSWGQRRAMRADVAGPAGGIRPSAGAGPAGRPADWGRAVRGRRRVLSGLAAAALIGLSAVTTWQVTRPAPAAAPVIAAERVAALSTQAGERTLATVVVRGDRANVVTDGLAPNAGRDTQYVVWGVPDGESGRPRVVGTFEVTAEGLQSYPVRLTQSLDGYPVLAVSEEPAGSTPTSPSRVLARGALGR